jgi:hypothetical protein
VLATLSQGGSLPCLFIRADFYKTRGHSHTTETKMSIEDDLHVPGTLPGGV